MVSSRPRAQGGTPSSSNGGAQQWAQQHLEAVAIGGGEPAEAKGDACIAKSGVGRKMLKHDSVYQAGCSDSVQKTLQLTSAVPQCLRIAVLQVGLQHGRRGGQKSAAAKTIVPATVASAVAEQNAAHKRCCSSFIYSRPSSQRCWSAGTSGASGRRSYPQTCRRREGWAAGYTAALGAVWPQREKALELELAPRQAALGGWMAATGRRLGAAGTAAVATAAVAAVVKAALAVAEESVAMEASAEAATC